MPRVRMTADEALSAIVQVLNAAPGKKMTHRDLVTALTAAGKSEAGDQVLSLAAGGRLSTIIEADGTGRPAMTVTLPSGG